MTVAEYLASELKKRGIKYVFGIPGGPSLAYIKAFKAEGIRFILTSNEAAAGIMADVTGRITGLPGICHATFGPGATNLSTGIGGALLDRSPLIAFTSQVPAKMKRRTSQMNVDHQLLFEPLTKATTEINNETISDVLNDVFELTMAEYPGPVHIGLPSDQADKEAIVAKNIRDEQNTETQIELDSEILDLLRYSKKPVLAVGLTAKRAQIKEELNAFLDKCPMPVIITPMAKGVISEDNDCYAGVLFHAASDKLNEILQEADLVIGLGYDPVEYNYEAWMPDVPLIHFNTIRIDMPDHLMIRQVVAPVRGILPLIEAVVFEPTAWRKEEISECRHSISRMLMKNSTSFGPVDVINTLNEYLPENLVLTIDVGSHIHLFGQYWRTGDNRTIFMTNGWSGMGFGIPAAIGAALNIPDKPVACVTGDGGFLMMCGEIVTARRLNLGILFIVLADNELNLIRLKEEKNEIKDFNTGLSDQSLLGEKTFLGTPVIRCESKTELENIVSDVYPLDEPLILELLIDPSDYKDLVVV